MNLLSVETSTKQFSLAVLKGKKIIKSRPVVLDKILSDSIVPSIDRILKQAGVPLLELDGLVVGLGPGSFTSLRVGMATAKALAFAVNKPMVGIPSLDAIAAGVKAQDCDQVCVLCDARRGLVYSAVYQRQGQELKRRTDYLLVPLADVLDKVKGRTLYVGDGVALFWEEIARRYKEAACRKQTGCQPLFSEEKFWYPAADKLIELALPKFRKKNYDQSD